MGFAIIKVVLADGKKTIDTLLATKNQSKTAALLRLTFDQVHGVMERSVKRGLSHRDPKHEYHHVCMDEKSYKKGHKYISILYDGSDGHVIDVADGRTKESVDKLCTKALTEEQCKSVKTVCTDMWDAFIYGAKEYFPNASHCHDLYHCVTYLNEAVDKVRKREVREHGILKKSKYLWLKDQSKYTDKEHERFKALEDMNFQVSQAWKVKELFRDIMHLHYDGDMDAASSFMMWFDDAVSYNIEEINGVAFMFKRHLKAIIRAMITGANNGKAERMNGSIQEIKTIGRGYRDAERFRIAILFYHGKLELY